MTKQAEKDYPFKVDPYHLYHKPYWDPVALREFGLRCRCFRRRCRVTAQCWISAAGPDGRACFARAGWNVVGVDISERMIEIAQQRAKQENVAVAFEVADMEDFDLGRRDFDGALLFDALHHCPHYELVLRRACEHLKPGGWLLVMEPSWLHLVSPHARKATRTYGVTELGFTRFGLRRDLRRAGFRSTSFYHDAGSAYRGLGGFLWANFRLWCAYLFCFPRIKQIVLAQK